MDYEDIYNRFEAVGQNVNVRNGRACARRAQNPVKDSIFFNIHKSGYYQKEFLKG